MRRTIIARSILLAVAGFALVPATAYAQSVFTGVVKHTSGSVLPGAVRLAIVAAVVVVLSIVSFAQEGKVDLTGKWVFTVETSAGSGTPNITLKQDGGKLTGHYSGQLGEADLTGSVKGQGFAFSFSVDAQGMKLDCTYTGSIESKDSLKGTVDISGLASGTFTAKRQ